MYLEAHISAVNRWENQIQALVEWDESAARKRAKEVADGPLKGWALGVKDIIDVAGLPTRCNADFLAPKPAAASAEIIDQLLALGAFVFSKTVTTTFAFFDPGPTCNPWRLTHTPGGSSSGSAAAVACGMVRLALGSQTVASVNRPASFCGVVGFKPSYGRISTAGVFPFSPSVDTLGFFSRDVRDAQTVFAALLSHSISSEPSSLRIGLIESLYVSPSEREMLVALNRAGEKLRSSGLEVQAMQLPSLTTEAYDQHWNLVAAEAAFSHRELFSCYQGSYPPKLTELIEQGRKVSAQQLKRIHSHRDRLRAEISRLFHDVDLFLTPSAVGAAPTGLAATGDPRFSLLWTYLGFPTLTLPVELTPNGLPLGVQLVGPFMQDSGFLAAARLVESLTSHPFHELRLEKFSV